MAELAMGLVALGALVWVLAALTRRSWDKTELREPEEPLRFGPAAGRRR